MRNRCPDLPHSELDLVLTCSHTKRCLLKAGISTLDQLMALSGDDMLQIKGIGRVIVKDVLREREEYLRRQPSRTDTSTNLKTYDHAHSIRDILKDARFVEKLADDNYDCNGHGMAYSGSKLLFRGTEGSFIVHTRLYRGFEPEQERILSLPADLPREAYVSFEAQHQESYSPWQDMIGPMPYDS